MWMRTPGFRKASSARRERRELEIVGLEDVRIRPEADRGPRLVVCPQIADLLEFVDRVPALERLLPDAAVAADLDLEAF